MKKRIWISVLLVAVLILSGCSIQTVEQMYQLPKRSEVYNNLQSVIDGAMVGLEYCAPLTGENQQTVQTADLDGDGWPEYLVFAKGTSDRPLRVLVFQQVDDAFVHFGTIESNGSAFDQVEYVQMDGLGGMELVIGRQLSDQLIRSVSVYSFTKGEAEQLLSANYSKFLTADLDADNLHELLLLRPGQTDTDKGIAELYGMEKGVMERSNEVSMSEPVANLKRIVVGKLHDGEAAVYAASTVEDTALITDVYACFDGILKNVSLSNESGTSVKTLRNYYVYADDIDNDGVVELPLLINMQPMEEGGTTDRHDLIRWYAMKSDGTEVDKLYTYHNFVGGWYVELKNDWAYRLTVDAQGNENAFYIWNENYKSTSKVVTIYTLTGPNKEEQATQDGRFVLLKTDSVIYAAKLEVASEAFGISQETVVRDFYLIQQDWKTGET